MSPASYFTGMEICTALSFRVEASSSLSLWGHLKRNLYNSITQRVKLMWKLNTLLILSPCRRHIDLNHPLNVFRIHLKFHFEDFLWKSDHITSLMSSNNNNDHIVQIVFWGDETNLYIASQEGVSNSTLHFCVIQGAVFLRLIVQNKTCIITYISNHMRYNDWGVREISPLL